MTTSRADSGTLLSARERQVALLYVEGFSHKEVARSLDIAPSTVRTHLNALYRKLKVANRIELLRHVSTGLATVASKQPGPAGQAPARVIEGQLLVRSSLSTGMERQPAEGPTGRRAPLDLETIDALGRRLQLIQAIAEGNFDLVSASGGLPRFRMRGNGQAEAAETRFAVANGHRIAYRSVGDEGPHGVPIVFLNRFRGSMDDWDPALINAVARDRRVIFFDNVGVGESDGQTPGCLERAADDAVGFIRALGLDAVDVLGWSLGGMPAQIMATKYPELVRKLALVATVPPCGSPDIVVTQGKWETVARQPSFTEEDLLYLYFSPSPEGSAAGRASLERISLRRSALEIKTRNATMRAQYQAATSFFRNEGNWYTKIKSIQAPTLVANGDRDPTFPAIDSVVLAHALPKCRLAQIGRAHV